MAKPVSEYEHLLKDSNVNRWYKNIERGSPAMAAVYLRRLGMVCKLFSVTPEGLSKKTVKEATDFLLDIVTKLDEEGKQPKYIKNVKDAINSWFEHNEIKVTKKIKLSEPRTPSKTSLEQSPMPGQVRLLLNACELKSKVASTLIGFAGLRLEVLGNYLGTDGLKIKDLPELKIDNITKKVGFLKIPTMVVVRASLSKAKHQYFTFYPSEGCEYLKQLLERRMANGESLNPDSPVHTNNKGSDMDHLATKQIGKQIKDYITKAGFDWRPYILRTYFDTRLMLVEADGLIIRDWRVFWMGHRGDIEHTYTVNKGRLPTDLIEKMRESFAKAAERHLVTTSEKETMSKDAVLATFNRQFLSIAGYSKEELDAIEDPSKLTPEDLQDLARRKSKQALGLNGNSQKVVPMSEVKSWISQGWEYVTSLPLDEAVVKLPSV